MLSNSKVAGSRRLSFFGHRLHCKQGVSKFDDWVIFVDEAESADDTTNVRRFASLENATNHRSS